VIIFWEDVSAMNKSKNLSLHRKKMGNVLLETRNKRGLSREQLAITTKLSLASIEHFERGVPNTITLSNLFKVAEALDIDKFDFMNRIIAAYRVAEAELSTSK
jgi:transcriptional regulator with XRE-family HTH domain